MERTRWRNGGRGNGGRINKTLRFCRRCIDVVFILSSLMSTCELDRFVIQTPYIKVLKSCSAPFVDRAGIGDDDTRTPTDGRGQTRTKRTNASMDDEPASGSELLGVRAPACQSVIHRGAVLSARAQSSSRCFAWKTASRDRNLFFFPFCIAKETRHDVIYAFVGASKILARDAKIFGAACLLSKLETASGSFFFRFDEKKKKKNSFSFPP